MFFNPEGPIAAVRIRMVGVKDNPSIEMSLVLRGDEQEYTAALLEKNVHLTGHAPLLPIPIEDVSKDHNDEANVRVMTEVKTLMEKKLGVHPTIDSSHVFMPDKRSMEPKDKIDFLESAGLLNSQVAEKIQGLLKVEREKRSPRPMIIRVGAEEVKPKPLPAAPLLLAEGNPPVVVSHGENGTQVMLINPLKDNPKPENRLKGNPVGGFLIHTDKKGKTNIYVIGVHGVQNHKQNMDIVQCIGMPEDSAVEVPKLLHPEQLRGMEKIGYSVNNSCRLRLSLPKDAQELHGSLLDLVERNYINAPFPLAVQQAIALSQNTEIGESALQLECERISALVNQSFAKTQISTR